MSIGSLTVPVGNVFLNIPEADGKSVQHNNHEHADPHQRHATGPIHFQWKNKRLQMAIIEWPGLSLGIVSDKLNMFCRSTWCGIILRSNTRWLVKIGKFLMNTSIHPFLFLLLYEILNSFLNIIIYKIIYMHHQKMCRDNTMPETLRKPDCWDSRDENVYGI